MTNMSLSGLSGKFSKLFGFKRNPSHMLGIDIGKSTVKIVGMFLGQNPSVLFYSIAALPADHSEKDITESILKTLKANNFPAKETVLTFTDESIIIRRIELPYMAQNEIRDALKWQIKDLVQFDMEKVYLDFKVLGEFQKSDGSKFIELMVVVASREMIDKRIQAVKDAGLDVAAINVTPFDLEGVIKLDRDIEPDKTFVAVDFGYRNTKISFFKNKNLEFIRALPIGSADITEALTATLPSEGSATEISREEAEDIKIRFGILYEEAEIGKGITARQVVTLMRPIIERLSKEIRRSIDYYIQEYGGEEVSSLYLAGGGSRLKNLDKYLTEVLNIPAKRLMMPKNIDRSRTDINDDNASSIIAIIGAVLGYGKALNLLPHEYRLEKAEIIEKISLRMIAIVMGGILIVSYFLVKIKVNDYATRLKNIAAQKGMLVQVKSLQERVAERQAFLDGANNMELPAEGVMKDLSNLIPPSVELANFSLSPKSRTLTIRGTVFERRGSAEETITRFMEMLEKSKYFKEAQLVSLAKAGDANEEAYSFDISCTLR